VCEIALGAIVIASSGCNNRAEGLALSRASFEARSARRAYDGAPPVIPHQPLGADCTVCHTVKGQAVPNLGFAPANPHVAGERDGNFANCRQCHVFQQSVETFRPTLFVGLSQTKTASQRLFPGAPPVIPHAIQLRGNCLACHAGPASRQEIVCSHPERTNCRQCHVDIQSQFNGEK
jgi:cytochrome c-type protein NapB